MIRRPFRAVGFHSIFPSFMFNTHRYAEHGSHFVHGVAVRVLSDVREGDSSRQSDSQLVLYVIREVLHPLLCSSHTYESDVAKHLFQIVTPCSQRQVVQVVAGKLLQMRIQCERLCVPDTDMVSPRSGVSVRDSLLVLVIAVLSGHVPLPCYAGGCQSL